MFWLRLSLSFIVFTHLDSHAQIQYTRDFTTKLRAATLRLNLPDSTWYKVMIPCEDQFSQYDLCLISERDSAELKYVILDDRATQKVVFPDVHFMNRLSNLATNDDRYWMRQHTASARMISDSLRADWAGEMSFTPKASLTSKKYAKLYSIYRQDTGMAYIILYYNFEFPGFNEHLHSLYFNLPKPNTND